MAKYKEIVPNYVRYSVITILPLILLAKEGRRSDYNVVLRACPVIISSSQEPAPYLIGGRVREGIGVGGGV